MVIKKKKTRGLQTDKPSELWNISKSGKTKKIVPLQIMEYFHIYVDQGNQEFRIWIIQGKILGVFSE